MLQLATYMRAVSFPAGTLARRHSKKLHTQQVQHLCAHLSALMSVPLVRCQF